MVIKKELVMRQENSKTHDYDEKMAELFAEKFHKTHVVKGILEEENGGI